MDGKSVIIGALVIALGVVGFLYWDHQRNSVEIKLPSVTIQKGCRKRHGLEDAHKGQEVMSAVSTAVRDERWGDAERCLKELQSISERLLRQVGDKTREALMVPKPDRGDRG